MSGHVVFDDPAERARIETLANAMVAFGLEMNRAEPFFKYNPRFKSLLFRHTKISEFLSEKILEPLEKREKPPSKNSYYLKAGALILVITLIALRQIRGR